MTIGFIGGGNMAGAIIKGLLAASLYRPEEVFVTDITPERSKDCAKRLGVAAADTAEALIEHADTVVLAVKPGVFPSLLPSIAPYLQEKNPLVISIAAGKTLGFIEEVLGVIAGSAPAFAYLFIDSLARAAVKNGMQKQVALEIAAQTVLGSAKLILEGGEHPWALIDQVCSPGGTTIEGIAALQDAGFEAGVRKSVDAALEKDRRL